MKKLVASFIVILSFLSNHLLVQAQIPENLEGYYQFEGESMVDGIAFDDGKFYVVYHTAKNAEYPNDPLIGQLLALSNTANDAFLSAGIIDMNLSDEEINEKKEKLKEAQPLFEYFILEMLGPFPRMLLVMNHPTIYHQDDVMRVRFESDFSSEWEFQVEDNRLVDTKGNAFVKSETSEIDVEASSH